MILATLGHPTWILANIGSDARGHAIVDELASAGVNVSGIHTSGTKNTGGIIEHVNPVGSKSRKYSYTCPVCSSNLKTPNLARVDQILEYIETAPDFDVFFFDRVNRGMIEVAKRLSRLNSLVYFEPNSISAGRNSELAAINSDVVKFASPQLNSSGSDWLPPSNSRTRLLIETRNSAGLKYRIKNSSGTWSQWIYREAIESQAVVDSAGAGDWLSAGIIHHLIKSSLRTRWNQNTISDAIQFGQQLATLSVSYTGSRGLSKNMSGREILRLANTGSFEVGAPLNEASERTLDSRLTDPNSGTCQFCLS